MPVETPARSALLVIDMQNDFLAEGGAFCRRHCDPDALSRTVGWLTDAASAQGRHVAWITSRFDQPPADRDALRGETHVGAPCCVPDTWGAEVFAPLAGRARDAALRVEKRWHSAFRETALHDALQARGVTRVVLCGVATNVCVAATARDALRLGYAVDVLHDATAAGTQSKHLAALRDLERAGVRKRGWAELLAECGTRLRVPDIAAGSVLWCHALGDAAAGDVYARVEREVAWSAMSHRGGTVPRLVALQGDRAEDGVEPLYRHPVDEQLAVTAWTPAVDAIRRAAEAVVGHPLNHALIQMYRTGRDWIREHSDKTLDLARPSNIVNVSLGRTRTMVLRPKREGAGLATQRVPLPHGSMLVMDLATNRDWYHAIRQQGPDDEGEDGPRISLTLRHIGTQWNPATGAVWGVGAPTDDRGEAERRAAARRAMDPAARAVWERDEAERMLRLFRAENVDADFDVAAYRPGFEVPDLRSVQ